MPMIGHDEEHSVHVVAREHITEVGVCGAASPRTTFLALRHRGGNQFACRIASVEMFRLFVPETATIHIAHGNYIGQVEV